MSTLCQFFFFFFFLNGEQVSVEVLHTSVSRPWNMFSVVSPLGISSPSASTCQLLVVYQLSLGQGFLATALLTFWIE